MPYPRKTFDNVILIHNISIHKPTHLQGVTDAKLSFVSSPGKETASEN